MKRWWKRRPCNCNALVRFVVFRSEAPDFEGWFIAGFRCEACGNWVHLSGPHEAEQI